MTETDTAVLAKTELVDTAVLAKTELVTDYERCAEILKEVQGLPDPIVGLDCEGLNVGMNGIITLVQIGLPDGRAFIFDVLKGPRLFSLGGLQAFLESKSVIKVMHDCRGDSVNLREQFGVTLQNVFDTQAAYTALQIQETGEPAYSVKHLGLRAICKNYGARFNIPKKDKSIYKAHNQYWEQRPLTQGMIVYSALDVLVLVPEVYESMNRQILPELRNFVTELSKEQALMNIDNEIDEYRIHLRKIYKKEIGELERKIIGAAEAQRKIDLTFKDIGLLRHLQLPTEIKTNVQKYYRHPQLIQRIQTETEKT